MNQNRYILHVARFPPTDPETFSHTQKALDECSYLLAQSRAKTSKPELFKDIRKGLQESLDDAGGILVWVEDSLPKEKIQLPRLVAFAEVAGGEYIPSLGAEHLEAADILEMHAIPETERELLETMLLERIIETCREIGFKQLTVDGNVMPQENLLLQHGFRDGVGMYPQIFILDLQTSRIETEQPKPPPDIPPSGNI